MTLAQQNACIHSLNVVDLGKYIPLDRPTPSVVSIMPRTKLSLDATKRFSDVAEKLKQTIVTKHTVPPRPTGHTHTHTHTRTLSVSLCFSLPLSVSLCLSVSVSLCLSVSVASNFRPFWKQSNSQRRKPQKSDPMQLGSNVNDRVHEGWIFRRLRLH